jgi:thymidylate kinase
VSAAKPLVIVITGPDGSGKSTACALAREQLSARLGDGKVVECSVWDCLEAQESISPAFRTQAEAAQYLGDLDGTSRTLFIFHAMSRALQLAIKKKPAVILLSGYWYKYAVSEIGYGVDPDFVLGASLGFARPAHVFCLDIDPATAWERRMRASAYEQGNADGNVGASERERFLEFQSKLRQVWAGLEAQTGLTWEHLSALDAVEDIVQAIVSGTLLRVAQAGASS